MATQRAVDRPHEPCSGRCLLLARCCLSAEDLPGESLCVGLLWTARLFACVSRRVLTLDLGGSASPAREVAAPGALLR